MTYDSFFFIFLKSSFGALAIFKFIIWLPGNRTATSCVAWLTKLNFPYLGTLKGSF